MAAHGLGQFEPVHFRHLHIEQGQGHVVFQQQLQRLFARGRLQQDQALAAQQHFQRQQVFLQVVDEKEIDGRRRGFGLVQRNMGFGVHSVTTFRDSSLTKANWQGRPPARARARSHAVSELKENRGFAFIAV